MTTTASRSIFPSLLVLLLLVTHVPRVASHATANPRTAVLGAYGTTAIRIGHGCDKAPTTNVTIEIPSAFEPGSVGGKQLQGWDITYRTEILEEPFVKEGGREVNEVVKAITWAGRLEHADFQEFGIRYKMLKTLPGNPEHIYLPVHQLCAQGGENLWVEIPENGQEWADLDRPAAEMDVVTKPEDEESDGDNGTDDDDDGDDGEEPNAEEEIDNASTMVRISTVVSCLVVPLAALLVN